MFTGLKYAFVVMLILLLSACTKDKKQVQPAEEEQVEIMVSPAIDLFGLISRLAGINQYKEVLLPEFITELDNYFGHLRDHPTIEFARECNITHQINGDAPMALAVYVGPPPDWSLRMDLSRIPAAFDPRWDSALISDYLEQARIFARESNFADFFQEHEEYQGLARSRLEEMLLKEQIFQWYGEYFGYYPERFLMYLSLLNGSASYGYPVFRADREAEFVSLIAGRFPDKQGIPTYPPDWFLPIIIHEYMHSYINPLIKGNPEDFKALGESLLGTHKAKMIERGYNVWNVILQEYLVRACTIRYLEQRESKSKARDQIKRDIRDGFPEIEGLVLLLGAYEGDRESYPDIKSFLPQIKAYLSEL